jgi:hypothetical protein
MSRFSEKIDALVETAALTAAHGPAALAASMAVGPRRRTLAVGSGGSAIACAFLARCRETLFGEPTETVSPMELVLGHGDLDEATVWILSAGADNPDTLAAVIAARSRGAGRIELVTRNPAGAAIAALPPAGVLHVVPVADPKDGFLTTHSLVSTLGALLLASDAASTDPVGAALAGAWLKAVEDATSRETRDKWGRALGEVTRDTTVILACDSGAATVGTLIETSLWEAAICPVQRTDLRNLGHGRHAWLHHRPGATNLIGVVATETQAIWSRIRALAPEAISAASMDLGDCGRFRNAAGSVEALALVEAFGSAVGVDPGKPGIGDFGRDLYADTSLLDLAKALRPCVRQKRDAVAERGDPEGSDTDLLAADAARVERIAACAVGAIVMDYDGTVVETEERFSPPRREVLDELVRLHAAGVVVAIATGRGGSAGEALRDALPRAMHSDVVMGYYNGGHVVPLSVDIARDPPAPNPAISQVADLVARNPQVTPGCGWRDSGVQLTIPTAALPDVEALVASIMASRGVAGGTLRVTRSAHSVDVVPAGASELSVIDAALARAAPGSEALSFGDSGAHGGNDRDLLARSYGISVGAVCGRQDGSHSLLGRRITGPQALVNVLRCIVPGADGRMRLDLDRLAVDTEVD